MTLKYESERLKFARDLIDFDRKWSKLFTGKPRTDENEDGISHEEFVGYVTSPTSLPP